MTSPAKRRLVIAGGDSGQEPVFEDRLLSAAVETDTAVVHELIELDPNGDVGPAGGAWHHDPVTDGAIFRVVRLKRVAGVDQRPLHRSPTIDVGFVLSGTVELTLPDGKLSTLCAGDSFVLRGIDHAWTNRGPGDCELAVLLMRPEQWATVESVR